MQSLKKIHHCHASVTIQNNGAMAKIPSVGKTHDLEIKQYLVILVNNIGRDFLVHDFVKSAYITEFYD